MLIYYPLKDLLEFIEHPQRPVVELMISDMQDRFVVMPGSTHNHQAWDGGYLDHIEEVMNLCVQLRLLLERTGRLKDLPAEEQFTLSDVLVVLFVHDLEKAFRIELGPDGLPLRGDDGKYVVLEEMVPKHKREKFKYDLIDQYGLALSDQQKQALHYVEGMRDSEYSPGARGMLPLDVLCHTL